MLQNEVTCVMAMIVVDLLEAIDVNKQDTVVSSSLIRAEELGQMRANRFAIECSGQLVDLLDFDELAILFSELPASPSHKRGWYKKDKCGAKNQEPT